MSIYDEAKVDCHCHVFDPARFPYGDDSVYRPAGQEIGKAAQLTRVLDAYGVRFALLVGPNSGYEQDNRCMLDAIANGRGRFKGIAVVPNDTGDATLRALKAAGIVGVAFNATFHGVDYYRDTAPLLDRLAALDLCVSLQVQHDQLVVLAPMFERSDVRVLIDHCGRPAPPAGLHQPGFRTLLRLAQTGRVFAKLSGYIKFAQAPFPYDDARPYVEALLDAFTPDRCMWASDWPFLRAPERIDYGPLLHLIERFVPDAAQRRRVLFETPCRLLGFGS
jgi:predicted TIM-barrel fold metal-dependent hydrolase